MSRPFLSVSHSTSTAPARAASTFLRTATRSTSSAISMLISRGAWVTPMRTSTVVLSQQVDTAPHRTDERRRRHCLAENVGYPSLTPGRAPGDDAFREADR